MRDFNLIRQWRSMTKLEEKDYLLIEAHSIGDVFHTLSLAHHLKEKDPAAKIGLICSPRVIKIAKLFDYIDSIWTPLTWDAHYLDSYLELLVNTEWYKNQNKIIVTTPAFHLDLNKDAKTGDDYLKIKKQIMGLPQQFTPKIPEKKISAFNNVLKSANEQGLTPNSLIIFNHAHSLNPLPAEVYSEIIKKFPGKVFYDSWSPQRLEGAQPINIGIEEVPYFADIAGTVLCMRSGITDILSISSAKIFTIYPGSKYVPEWIPTNNREFIANFFRTWGIKDLSLNTRTTEIKIFIENNDDIHEMSKKISTAIYSQVNR